MSTEPTTPTSDRVPGVPDELPDEPEALRQQIQETREELGKTVESLAAKVDVKAQVKEKLDDVKAQAKEKQEEVAAKVVDLRERAVEAAPEQAAGAVQTLMKPPVLGAIAAVVIILLVWRIKR